MYKNPLSCQALPEMIKYPYLRKQKGHRIMANPIVTITMENGDVMKAELYPDIAPNTVNNFISLIKKGYYDGLIFHRVIKGFMIQGDARREPEWAVQATASGESF